MKEYWLKTSHLKVGLKLNLLMVQIGLKSSLMLNRNKFKSWNSSFKWSGLRLYLRSLVRFFLHVLSNSPFQCWYKSLPSWSPPNNVKIHLYHGHAHLNILLCSKECSHQLECLTIQVKSATTYLNILFYKLVVWLSTIKVIMLHDSSYG